MTLASLSFVKRPPSVNRTAPVEELTKVCTLVLLDTPTLTVIVVGVLANISNCAPDAGSPDLGYVWVVALLSVAQVNVKLLSWIVITWPTCSWCDPILNVINPDAGLYTVPVVGVNWVTLVEYVPNADPFKAFCVINPPVDVAEVPNVAKDADAKVLPATAVLKPISEYKSIVVSFIFLA